MTWANEQTIRETYLAAFEPAVTVAHAKGAMTVMNRIGYTWGGAHEGLLTNVLRGEWGFDGMVITDYSSNSNYTSHVNGLQGGSDLWDGIGYAETNTQKLTAYKDDAYVCQLMRQAVHRILYVQVNSSAMNGLASDDQIVTILTWWQTTLICADIAAGFLVCLGIAMIIVTARKGKETESLTK
jgi:beta-glucosidase